MCFKSATEFQFHKGTIKTMERVFHLVPVNLFQFHKGTIKTVVRVLESTRFVYFNSIKVRLKLLQNLFSFSL